MGKRKIYLLLLASVALAVVLLVVFNREREPEYRGKRLSEWVEENPFDAAGPDGIHPVRQMGTNAVPYLLKWIRYERPVWKRKLYAAVNPIIKRLNASWELTDQKDSRAYGAAWTLAYFRPAVVSAVAELTMVLNDPKGPESAIRASHVLASLGADGLPSLIAVLTNQQMPSMHRWVVATDLGTMGTNALGAVPALLEALNDTNAEMKSKFTRTLLKIDPKALERATP